MTGANTGLGQGIALALAEAGADIAGAGIVPADETAGKVRALGRRFVNVDANLMSIEPVDRIVRETLDGLGGLDILVNNAGLIRRADSVASSSSGGSTTAVAVGRAFGATVGVAEGFGCGADVAVAVGRGSGVLVGVGVGVGVGRPVGEGVGVGVGVGVGLGLGLSSPSTTLITSRGLILIGVLVGAVVAPVPSAGGWRTCASAALVIRASAAAPAIHRFVFSAPAMLHGLPWICPSTNLVRHGPSG